MLIGQCKWKRFILYISIIHAIGPDLMQCIFRANKMANASITNVDTGDSTDVVAFILM